MLILLYTIGLWVATGVILYGFTIFVYCRGPKNYIDLLIFSLDLTKNSEADRFKKIREKFGDYYWVTVTFIVSSMFGPFILFDIIRFITRVNKCLKIAEKKSGG